MRALIYVNLVGVLALAVVCAFQWEANRLANLEAVRLDKLSQEQDKTLKHRAAEIKADQEDIESFRARVERYETDLDECKSRRYEAEAAFAHAEQRLVKMNHDRVQTNFKLIQAQNKLIEEHNIQATWEAAVKQRDEVLHNASDEIKKLAKERNDAVARFNDLADKYNALVKETSKPTR